MTDRPIIFSAVAVRALLDGRKTQTRRMLKPQPFIDRNGNFCTKDRIGRLWNYGQHIDGRPCTRNYIDEKLRHVGDKLWVREAWKAHSTFNGIAPRDISKSTVFYLADNTYSPSGAPGRPSIFMPRWASRMTLTVTGVRVMRLQDIDETDAIAEGVHHREVTRFDGVSQSLWFGLDWVGNDRPVNAFTDLWEHINNPCGLCSADNPAAWEANPWVAAYTFSVRQCNIDKTAFEENVR